MNLLIYERASPRAQSWPGPTWMMPVQLKASISAAMLAVEKVGASTQSLSDAGRVSDPPNFGEVHDCLQDALRLLAPWTAELQAEVVRMASVRPWMRCEATAPDCQQSGLVCSEPAPDEEMHACSGVSPLPSSTFTIFGPSDCGGRWQCMAVRYCSRGDIATSRALHRTAAHSFTLSPSEASLEDPQTSLSSASVAHRA